GLLSERAHRAFRLWGPSLFHHLFVPEKPQSAAGAFTPLRKTAESDYAVADFQRSVRGRAVAPFRKRTGLSSGAFGDTGPGRFDRRNSRDHGRLCKGTAHAWF